MKKMSSRGRRERQLWLPIGRGLDRRVGSADYVPRRLTPCVLMPGTPLEETLYEDADHPLPKDGKEHPHRLYDHRGRLRILLDGGRPATLAERVQFHLSRL